MKLLIITIIVLTISGCSYDNSSPYEEMNGEPQLESLTLDSENVHVASTSTELFEATLTSYHLPDQNKVLVIRLESNSEGVHAKSALVDFGYSPTDEKIKLWVSSFDMLLKGLIPSNPIPGFRSYKFLPDDTISVTSIELVEDNKYLKLFDVAIFVARTVIDDTVIEEFSTVVEVIEAKEIYLSIPQFEESLGGTAGIRPGDKLVSIDGVPVSDYLNGPHNLMEWSNASGHILGVISSDGIEREVSVP